MTHAAKGASTNKSPSSRIVHMKPVELTKEQEEKVRAKINKLLDEKNYSEAAKLMVGMVVVKIDPDEFTKALIEKVKEYQRHRDELHS